MPLSTTIPRPAPKSSSDIRPTTYTGVHMASAAMTSSARARNDRGRAAQIAPPAIPPSSPTVSPPASRLRSAGRPWRIRSCTSRLLAVRETPKSK